MNKKIAIIRDGKSDFKVLTSFIKSILNTKQNISLPEDNFIDTNDLNIADAIAKYLGNASKGKETTINDKPSSELGNAIIAVLTVATRKYELTHNDIIILNTDAEHILIDKKIFFEKEWIKRFYCVIYSSIEKFYEQMTNQGYSYDSLPIIIPFIPFPSIEILIAACLLSEKDIKTIRTLKANPDLKQKVWGTANIPMASETGKIEEVLNLCFNNGDETSLKRIYKEIPEVRNLIHILTIKFYK